MIQLPFSVRGIQVLFSCFLVVAARVGRPNLHWLDVNCCPCRVLRPEWRRDFQNGESMPTDYPPAVTIWWLVDGERRASRICLENRVIRVRF